MSRKERFPGSFDEQLQRYIEKQNYNSLEKEQKENYIQNNSSENEEKNSSKENRPKTILIKKQPEIVEIGSDKEKNNISERISPEEGLTFFSGGSEDFHTEFTWELTDIVESRDQWEIYEKKPLPFTATFEGYRERKDKNGLTVLLSDIDIRDNNINCKRVKHVWISNPEDVKKFEKYNQGQRYNLKQSLENMLIINLVYMSLQKLNQYSYDYFIRFIFSRVYSAHF
jgi:hypothetical protein